MSTLDSRAHLLRAAVGFALVPPTEPERVISCSPLAQPMLTITGAGQ